MDGWMEERIVWKWGDEYRQTYQNKQLLEVVRRSAELFWRDWVEQARFYDNNNKDDDDGEELQSPFHFMLPLTDLKNRMCM